MNHLELRAEKKKKQPKFIRQDFHKKRLKKRWVKPRGLHSKVRMKRAGHPKKVADGYGSPKDVRGLSKEGLNIIRIHNEKGLEGIDKEKDGVIISNNVGLKNKLLLLKKIKELGIKVLNLDVDDYIKKKEEEIKKRLEKKSKKKVEKKKKEEEKKEKKDKLEEKLTEEEIKDKNKQEKDKLLTKREV